MNKLMLRPTEDHGHKAAKAWRRQGPHELHYVDTGPRESAAAPFLLVHGLGASLNYWAAIIPELSRDRRVIAIDIPGFGDSPALAKPVTIEALTNAIVKLVTSLGIQRPILVGHSLGGLLAILLAKEVETEKVVLLDGHLISVYELIRNPRNALSHPKLAMGMVLFLSGLLIPFRGSIVRILARHKFFRVLLFSYLVARPAKLNPDLLRVAFSKTRNRGILAALMAVRSVDVTAVMKATSVRTAVAWGTEDPLLLERDTTITKRLLHPESMHKISDCGHWPMLERPAEVLRILRAAADDPAVQGPC
jgi:pimeloyl-ACP methyl ester carboxylesterase